MMQTPESHEVVVLGSGAWGTTLALLLERNGHRVRLWCRSRERAETLTRERENAAYLAGVPLPPELRAEHDLERAVDGAVAAVLALPMRALPSLLERLPPPPGLISGTKGIDPDGFRRVSEIVGSALPGVPVAALSGPNLAAEIAAGKPAAATLATPDDALAEIGRRLFHQSTFRVYRSRDLVGVEVAGALKNVVALAAGMVDGLELGENARASIVTRGLAEIARVGATLDADPRTFYGLAGVGDLVATCASRRSRNHTAGERLARGERLADLERSRLTAEGIGTARAAHAFAQRRGLELPIAAEVYRVVFEDKSPQRAVADLMGRAARDE